MVQTPANSLSVGGQGQGQGQWGAQVLQELEQALYQAGQQRRQQQQQQQRRQQEEPQLVSGGRQYGNASSPKPGTRWESMPVSESEGERETLAALLRSKPPVRGKKGESVDRTEYEEDDVMSDENMQGRGKLDGREKRKGLWSWKPFRALAHVGQQRYKFLISIHVHGIESLPSVVNGLRLGVNFGKKDDVGVQTMPSRVLHGQCEFQETLYTRCTVHGTMSGAKGMKWEAKQFVVSVIALDVDELVFGRHKVELTRLLPESIEDDVGKQETWTTSFKLTGKAQGGTLVVTFGCDLQTGTVSASTRTGFGESPVLRALFGESPILRATRSFFSSPKSEAGTPSRYGSGYRLSPSMSEPAAVFHAMEHLSLDDFNYEEDNRGGVHSEIRAEDANSHGNGNVVGEEYVEEEEEEEEEAEEEEEDQVEEEEEEEEEEEVEFTVIDKGVEVSSIVDTGRRYDAIESENMADFEVKEVDVSTKREFYDGDVSPEAEDRYEECDFEVVYKDSLVDGIDVYDDSPGAVADPSLAKENVKQDDTEDSGTRSESFSDSLVVSRSIDDKLEMRELLDERGRKTGGEEGADSPNAFEEDVKDVNDDSRAAVADPGLPKESVKQDDPQDSRTRSEGFSDSMVVLRSVDDELEMRELLDTLNDQERETGREDGADSPNDLEEDDFKDDVTEEELLSFLPGGNELESDMKESPSKELESDDEFENVTGEFLSLLESDMQRSPIPLTSEIKPDSPYAMSQHIEKETMIERNMKVPELEASEVQPGVPDFHVNGAPEDCSMDAMLISESHGLHTHEHANSEDFNNLGWDSEEDAELAFIMEAAESELQKATQSMRSKNRAKMLEDEETESLMQEWGLNKEVFEGSSRSDDTGNPLAMVSFEPPPLAFHARRQGVSQAGRSRERLHSRMRV